MGVDVINVGKIDLEPRNSCFFSRWVQSEAEPSDSAYCSSLKVIISSTWNRMFLHVSRSGGSLMSFMPCRCPGKLSMKLVMSGASAASAA